MKTFIFWFLMSLGFLFCAALALFCGFGFVGLVEKDSDLDFPLVLLVIGAISTSGGIGLLAVAISRVWKGIKGKE